MDMSTIERFASQQDREVPLVEKETPWGSVHYLYGRATDRVESESSNQDFLAFRYDHRRLVFAVCDGVSQSWDSKIAAKEVAQDLTSWLWRTGLSANEEGVREQVEWRLSEIVQPMVNRQAESVPIPPFDPDDVILDVLTRWKEKIGSETIFFAGKVVFDPDRQDDYVTLFWMGNTKGLIHQNGRWVDVAGGEWSDKNRFSSKRGLRGKISVWTGPLEGIDRILVHTDGLEIADQLIAQENASAPAIEQASDKLKTTSAWRHDDVALLDLSFHSEPIVAREPVPIKEPAPEVVAARDKMAGVAEIGILVQVALATAVNLATLIALLVTSVLPTIVELSTFLFLLLFVVWLAKSSYQLWNR